LRLHKRVARFVSDSRISCSGAKDDGDDCEQQKTCEAPVTINKPTPSFFTGRMASIPVAQPTVSKQLRQTRKVCRVQKEIVATLTTTMISFTLLQLKGRIAEQGYVNAVE